MSILLENIYVYHWRKFPVENYIHRAKFPVLNDTNHIALHIKDSINYGTLVSQNYDMYNKFINITDQREHSESIFRSLQEKFNITQMPKIKICFKHNLGKYIITDGVHRLAVMVKKGFATDSIDLKYLHITFDDETISQVINILKKTTGIMHYNHWINTNKLEIGYHSFVMGNRVLKGQRNPIQRLEGLKKHIDFKNKTVVDFGCNTGGMLLHLPEISRGVGIDYDGTCINAASYIRDILKHNNHLNFHRHDFDKDSPKTLSLLINFKPDVIFLLSLGSWIKKWRELYSFAIDLGSQIVLETNNDSEGTAQLEFFEKKNCTANVISVGSADDITGNHKRKLYLIQKNV